MSNKTNFSQAMREIFGVDSKDADKAQALPLEAENAEKHDGADSASNDRLNKNFSDTFQTVSAKENIEVQNDEADEEAFYEKPSYKESSKTGSSSMDGRLGKDYSSDIGPYGSVADDGRYNQDDVGTTIITKNTVIEGNIKSFENIELNGNVKGKIETTKNVGVSGCVQGNIAATDVLLEGAQIKGNILSKGALLMDKETLLLGDVEAQNTRVDGKIKGEVHIGGNGEFLSNSVVVGDITVSNFYVQYGARMQGYINTNFSKNEEDSIFGKLAGN
ncbi:MAG: bactofilin family protein [Eubacteriales bacterium]